MNAASRRTTGTLPARAYAFSLRCNASIPAGMRSIPRAVLVPYCSQLGVGLAACQFRGVRTLFASGSGIGGMLPEGMGALERTLSVACCRELTEGGCQPAAVSAIQALYAGCSSTLRGYLLTCARCQLSASPGVFRSLLQIGFRRAVRRDFCTVTADASILQRLPEAQAQRINATSDDGGYDRRISEAAGCASLCEGCVVASHFLLRSTAAGCSPASLACWFATCLVSY
jgi:hypothetical protein